MKTKLLLAAKIRQFKIGQTAEDDHRSRFTFLTRAAE
jgi:hypothetical protein